MARYKPFASSFQSRFKWRHKPGDKWRRLMDSTCFSVDWITRPMGPTMTQSSGFWTHIVLPAHCACPWNYPNYYPPVGETRFVSKITYADTRTQIRFVSQQGDVSNRFFLSNNHTFCHSNPRLDLAVIHPEQHLRRQGGEMKLVHMQNTGQIMRPMLDIAAPVQKGDIVWIYGLTAEEALFDEEKGEEPKMIPTAIRGIVHATTREQFWVDTLGEEVHMGMCGAPIMRNGKCIGMLTAKVHAQSLTKELAGCAMCTYSKDMFEFLVEVEEQLKNGVQRVEENLTRFERQREEEVMRGEGHTHDRRSRVREYRDWEKDQTRLARRVQVPLSSFRDANDVDWNTQQDYDASNAFGPSGNINDEVQENFGYHMNEERDKHGKPERMGTPPAETTPGVSFAMTDRKDLSPNEVIHGEDAGVVNGKATKYAPKEELPDELKDIVRTAMGQQGEQFDQLHNLKHVISNIHRANEEEALRESAFGTAGGDDKAAGVYNKTSTAPNSNSSAESGAADANRMESKGVFGGGFIDIKADRSAENISVAGLKIPKSFVQGVTQYHAIDKKMKEDARKGQFRMGEAPEEAEAEATRENVKPAGSSAEEERRRMARKAQRAADKAKRDAAHNAALRARLGHDEETMEKARRVNGDDVVDGLW